MSKGILKLGTDVRGNYRRDIGWEPKLSGDFKQHTFYFGTNQTSAKERCLRVLRCWDAVDARANRAGKRPLWTPLILSIAKAVAAANEDSDLEPDAYAKEEAFSQRRRGAQPDHPPHRNQMLLAERVSHTKHFLPEQCTACHAPLPPEAGPDDPQPKRFQTIELPPITVEVIEYQAHGRTCPRCGVVTQATIPVALRAHSVGPRLTATLSYLTGCHGISKRGVEEIADIVFGAPIALGTVANLEQEVSVALIPAHDEALDAVRRAEVKFADETSWKLWGKLCWLWAAATANVAGFVVHAKRSVLGLAALLGEEIDGILHSDRWHVYLCVPEERRQLCWAHLKRDFQKIVDRGSPFVGRRGLRIVKDVFAAWHAFQKGSITRRRLQTLIEPLQRRLGQGLLEGGLREDARVAQFCENVLLLESALWTFVTQEGSSRPTTSWNVCCVVRCCGVAAALVAIA